MFIPHTRHYSGFYVWTPEEDIRYREHQRLRQAVSQSGLPVAELRLARGAGHLLVLGANNG
ncbi:MAG: hypothetical protein ACRDGA_00060, partial [Bacteroidota bacterium]